MLRTALVVALAAALVSAVAGPARAQGDPFGPQPGPGGQPPKEPEYVRPKEALEPLPEPLSADEEKARERAKERGVLLSDNPKSGFISELRIEGAKKVEPDAVLVQIQTRVDKKPDKKALQADIRRVYAMDIFDEVTVVAREGKNDSIVIIFRLKEKPAVDEILIEGNQEVSKDDILEVVDIKPYQVLDVAKVRANVDKIQKLYVDKGFFLAAVTSEVKPSTGTSDKSEDGGLLDLFKRDGQSEEPTPPSTDPNVQVPTRPVEQEIGEFVDVVFTVKEAAKVKIESITFVGNEHVGPDELRNFMKTQQAHPLGVLNEWGTYKEDAQELDLLGVESVYQDKGYINVRVGKPRVQLSADKTRIAMEIPITEGKSYKLRTFDIAGDLIYDTPADVEKARADGTLPEIYFLKEDLIGRTKLRSGDVFSRSQVAMDLQAVADRYRDRGYAYVNINPDTPVQEKETTLDLILKVQSGPRVKIERIEITGNAKTQDSVIRRELRIYEGEWYAASDLRKSEARVNALGYFEPIKVTTRPGSEPNRMVIVVDVKEKSTGTFQLGAGFSNAENILFTGQIAYNNFLGLGKTVSGSVQWSSLRRIFDVRYIDPYQFYIGQEPVTLAFSLFNTSRYYLDFVRDSTGGDVTLGYPIGRPLGDLSLVRDVLKPIASEAPPSVLPYIPDPENLQLFLAYNLERVVINESNFTVRLLGLQTNLPRWSTSVRTSMVFDQRNNRLFPSAGWYVQGTVEFANPYLGSTLLPGVEQNVKQRLVDAGVKDNIGFLYRTGLANDFQRYGMTLRWYLNGDELLPIKGIVLKQNVELGFINSSNQLVFENYYMGGFNTIRGYFIRSISPVGRVGPTGDPSAALVEFRTGGNKQLFSNLELEFPILEQVGIRGVAFFDAGNVYAPDENFFYFGNGPNPLVENARCQSAQPDASCWDARTELPIGLFYSVGLGVRWFSPIGPLRFEFGIPLTPRPVDTFGFRQGDQPFQFEFNVGNSF